MHLLFERRWDESRCVLILKSITEIMKKIKSLYDFGRRCLKIRDVCMDFEPHCKVHNLVSVHPKSIILGQITNLNMIFSLVVSVYRLVKIWNSPQFPDEFRNGQLLFWVHLIFFHSLPSRVGCSFQGKLFSIFKLLCLVFVRYHLSSRTALENYVLFVIALRSSWENFFADTRHWQDLFCSPRPLTYPGSASVQCDCTGELSIRFRKHSPSLPKRV